MRRYIAALTLAIGYFAGTLANAAEKAASALDRPLREHFAMFVMTMLGGLASFAMSVRKGEASAGMLLAAVGGMAASAVAGFSAYFVAVEWFGLAGGLASGAAGLAGYMGGRGLEWAERMLLQRAARVLGEARPLDDRKG